MASTLISFSIPLSMILHVVYSFTELQGEGGNFTIIYVKCLRTPILCCSGPLLHANYMNLGRSEIYGKRAFFWRQAEVSSSNSLEMAPD